VAVALQAAPSILAEQGIDPTAEATVNGAALLTGGAVAGMVDNSDSATAFDTLVMALIQDAGRTASAVDGITRRAVTGYTRFLSPPSCSRCAILAGRVYRYSTGFQRHPRCDCTMTPTNHSVGPSLTTDPLEAYRAGQVRGLSKGDQAAIDHGADMGQVVNVRRKQAGLIEGSSVMVRAGRPTPQFINRVASDRGDALNMLARYGYIR
jgi:hypothetical protein